MWEVGFDYGLGLANNLLIKTFDDNPEVYATNLTSTDN